MMEPVISEIMGILQASPADYLIFVMGMGVAMWILSLTKRIKCMEIKYHALDKDNVRLWDRLYPGEIKDHHSGDYFHPPNRAENRAADAAHKVLHRPGSSKAAKTRAGSALTQRINK